MTQKIACCMLVAVSYLCGTVTEGADMDVKQVEVRVPVQEHKEDLLGAIDRQVEQMKQDGYVVQDRYYQFSWTVLTPGKAYEARFEKLLKTPSGEPVILSLIRNTGTEVAFAFINLHFGSGQETVKQTLATLEVGQYARMRFDF